jgi:hypothetical protein
MKNESIILQVLRRDLVHALEKKRPGVQLEHFILHMDNASSHTAAATDLEVAVLGFTHLTRQISLLSTSQFFQ